jgi:hypothetical protein
MSHSPGRVAVTALPARRSRRRGRLSLPAAPLWPHARWGAVQGVCLVTADAALVEIARGLVGGLRLSGLWTTPSLPQARQWLDVHTGCRLLLVDAAEGLWLADPASPFGPASQCLERPFTAGEVAAAARKFFHPCEEKIAA